MRYIPMKLQSLKPDLIVRRPNNHKETAVLENLTAKYNIDDLKSVLDEIREHGVRNVVLDLTGFLSNYRRQWLAFLEGAVSLAAGFETRYLGILPDKAYPDEPEFVKRIAPKISTSLDAAVESFYQQ